jgi:hypothetical protein
MTATPASPTSTERCSSGARRDRFRRGSTRSRGRATAAACSPRGPHRLTVYEPGGRERTTAGRARIAAAAFPPTPGAPAILEQRRGTSALRLLGRREPLIETSGRYRGLVWSPDGRWILTRWGGRWLAVRRDGRRVTTHEAHGRPLAWVR